MTRDTLSRLRRATLAFRDAVRRDQVAYEAAREARSARMQAARELTAELQAAAIPEGLGFEESGIVVWWEEASRRADHLGHVFLSHYRGEG